MRRIVPWTGPIPFLDIPFLVSSLVFAISPNISDFCISTIPSLRNKTENPSPLFHTLLRLCPVGQ